MAEGGEELSLEYTPTWIVASVITAIVLISLLFERALHHLGRSLKNNEMMPLYEALEKVKEELMLVGFIALMLNVFQGAVQKICVEESLMKHFLPCTRPTNPAMSARYSVTSFSKILLGSEASSGYCHSKGKVPLLSVEAIDQLHIFIFLLAVTHVILTLITVTLGHVQMRKWRKWEDLAHFPRRQEQAFTNIERFQFIQDHFKGYDKAGRVHSWLNAFGKQFYTSVTKEDYITMRHGFVVKNCPALPNYNFYKYMARALQADFQEVAGISWYLWSIVIVFWLLNVEGWHVYFWISLVPLVLLLLVGTKLEHIITELAIKVAKKRTVIEGELVINPSDTLFWFNQPKMVLVLLHIILFQNAFQIAHFFWMLFTFGYHSCMMEEGVYIFLGLGISFLIQILCGYITLPIYAIVSHMGDSLSKAIFDKHVAKRITDWAQDARNTVEVSAHLRSQIAEGFIF